MTGVEKLTKSIMDEAEAEAEITRHELLNKKEHARTKMLASVEFKTCEILDDANKQGAEKKKRMLAVYGLELRKTLLKAKREALDEAYEKALNELLSLPKGEYLAIVKKLLLKAVSTGDESVLVSPEEKHIDEAFLKGVNSELMAQGKAGKLHFGAKTTEIQSGFILQQGGLFIDCSFERTIMEMRESTETQTAKILFG